MGEVVNLNTFRKQKARKAAREAAEVNRVLHGQTKDEKTLNKTTKEKADKDLDNKKRDDD
ncbi:MAG: DUF4169 domain-containing protein [Hirschia sp.]|nr:DUF4169 domain-containing protein [Hirschia sp.]MBF19550.1 DUF4169 domain-containing protein [Hirschia sp.]